MHKLLPPSLVLLLALVMVVVTIVEPIAQPISGWARLPGAAVGLAGLALTMAGSQRFVRIGTNIKTFDDPDVLVTSGPFGFSRNPMYLGFAVALAGLALGLGSIAAWPGPVAFAGAANFWYIPFEEKRMAHTFKDDYATYARRVRRWVGVR